MSPDVNAPVMGPLESSHQHGPPLLGRVRGANPFPDVLARMQPSDSLPPVGRGSGRPWPVAYPVPRATRRKKGLPGARAVLFQRAVGSDPAGCASRLAHRVETAIAFRLHNALGTQNERYFVTVNPTAHSLACLRIGVFVTADAARLATGVGGSPFTGRVSHPLDGEQSFMTSPHRHSTLTSLAWSHHATTPQSCGAGSDQMASVLNSMTIMATCFVIQPFDGGAFDKRYDDVFVPAIAAADLEAYRVDRDPSAAVPIEEVENGIRIADACLADISEPNPNVWFELGFAFATGKPVVMVCNDGPNQQFPFDVQHRTIIRYKTESDQDFHALREQIAARLRAAILKKNKLGQLAQSSVLAGIAGLNNLEVVALATIAENADAPDSFVPASTIRRDMESQGYTKVAVTLSAATLLKKNMLETRQEQDFHGNTAVEYAMTDAGLEWLIQNQSRLVLRHETKEPTPEDPSTDNDIQF